MSQDDMYAVAAHWWRNALEKPAFDNSSQDQANIGAKRVATMIKDVIKLTDQELQNFELHLMLDLIDYANGLTEPFLIRCHYEPCELLIHAAAKAGIEKTAIFPWKISMLIDPTANWIKISLTDGDIIKMIYPISKGT